MNKIPLITFFLLLSSFSNAQEQVPGLAMDPLLQGLRLDDERYKYNIIPPPTSVPTDQQPGVADDRSLALYCFLTAEEEARASVLYSTIIETLSSSPEHVAAFSMHIPQNCPRRSYEYYESVLGRLTGDGQ